MIEIHIRAWDGVKFVYPSDIWLGNENGDLQSILDEFDWKLYTGLKDKNNVEIYEGDVIGKKKGGKFLVGFDNGSFTLDHIGHCKSNIGSWHTDELTVLGNIYETPELLERAK